ncbi:ArsR/SmtB family transcription factor [Nevskia soli]|uniref:ArsR/SmtB family transcription factor n=1 Tax=Nevskia soli TaxID=418856 RepID=UPI0004A740C0|nr:transcriptional regulator [Nevskia soli]
MSKPFVVSSPAQLEVIASPGREEVIDAVVLIGPCSVSELARQLGRSRHALYYHVKALRDCGLLIETSRPVAGARDTCFYEVPGRPVSVRFDLSTPMRRHAVTTLTRARLQTAFKGVARACASDATVTDGPLRELWATHVKGWLSEADLEEVNELFLRLVDVISRASASQSTGRQAFDLTFALSPVRRKARRASHN